MKMKKYRLMAAAMAAMMLLPPSALAAPGDITDNSGLIPFAQAYFAFEVESPIGSLTGEPTWNEIEQMLDNPYLFVLDPSVPGNYQNYPSYRSTVPRRRSFVYRNGAGEPCAPASPGCVEVPHSGFLVHPLNYNHGGGEECRLLNLDFAGGPWQVPYQLVQIEAENTDINRGPLGVPVYEYTYSDIVVSPGIDRIETEEASPDFNSPAAPDDQTTCIVTVDQFFSPGPSPVGSVLIPEGSIVCGGDPGEPGYAGYGVLLADSSSQYSTPCVPGVSGPTDPIDPAAHRLYDPARGVIEPRDPVTGEGGLRKPSLRIPEVGGSPAAPNYLVNSEANLEDEPAELAPSNENDYVRDRDAATALGKALFWDMQVGSDGVQACASCHFHAGADDRTKAQLNPNHLGGDLTLQLGSAAPLPDGSQPGNQEVTAADFPFHKLADPEVPLEATNCGLPGLAPCPPGLISDTNDVMSSMGVIFGQFFDIPTPGPGAFGPAAMGVAPLLPDLRSPNPVDNLDPIPVFEGLRRVEPRNTPTFFASAMNFDNFWDGRARHDFNGGSVFGPADPQAHVMVDDAGTLVSTRQIIRFASLASLATGPALSDFEMSFLGRNWAKLAKKLLQNGVTPLANQLVDPSDSVLGPYSGQRSMVGGPVDLPGRPGLNISYPELIQLAFYPALWSNTIMHFNGCYTDGLVDIHPNQCDAVGVDVAIPVFENGAVVESAADPFDNYVLTAAAGPVATADTNQFTQMEANMPLFFGLSVHLWGTILVPDDTPMDRFFDANPDSHTTFGESGEPFLVTDLLNCSGENGTGGTQPCFTEVGNFKRDSAAASPSLIARINCTLEGGADCDVFESHGTRQPGDPDPLRGLDFFLGSNMSLKNPNFRSLRCGECHAGGTLTDHTFGTSHQVGVGDWVPEFRTGQPGIELFPENLGRGRVISGFLLEGELQENAQDGIERNIADQCVVEPCVDPYGNPIPGGVAGGFPQGQALFDNGMYNIGVRPISEDVSRGGTDAFGWPLSLSYLALKNLGGLDYTPGGDDPANGFALPPAPGNPLPNFDPAIDPTSGGLFEFTSQDQQINPGFAEEPCPAENDEGECIGLLPPYLSPWASNIPVGDESNIDELFVGLNTLMAEPMLEGFVDAWGPFNPAAILGEAFNNARQPEMAMWPNVNRVNTQGAFKAPPLRNVELTGPYFHNGSKLTLRQEVDFYDRGGDFPKMNAAHRDFLIVSLGEEDEALGGCVDPATNAPVPVNPDGTCPAGSEKEFTEAEQEAILTSMIDFLLELTDERVAFERAPFDHPEIIVPIDGTAPDNTGGRSFLLADPTMFRQVPAVGEGGNPTRLKNFLGVASTPGPGPDHYDSVTDCVLTGDLNGDSTVSLADFIIFRQNFGTSGVNVPGDFNNDGTVNLLDFVIFRSNFGASCP